MSRGKSKGSLIEGQAIASKLLGPLGVCFRRKGEFVIGQYTSNPDYYGPPWPIEVWGVGLTLDVAVEHAIREVEAEHAAVAPCIKARSGMTR